MPCLDTKDQIQDMIFRSGFDMASEAKIRIQDETKIPDFMFRF